MLPTFIMSMMSTDPNQLEPTIFPQNIGMKAIIVFHVVVVACMLNNREFSSKGDNLPVQLKMLLTFVGCVNCQSEDKIQ